MFKNIFTSLMMAVIVLALGASACTAQAAPESPITQIVPETESIPAEPEAVAAGSSALTDDEIAGLLYMYEEEKLARDVYNALYAQWGQPTFQSIATSEQAHMDAVYGLLVRYGVTPPASTAGVYSDPTLQSLYSSLMSTGSQSLADALKVGATIEEVDIADLQSRLAATTNTDIQFVYNNLMQGSFNHLRSYVRVLGRLTGETYQPQHLDADLYQSIITSSNGNGYGNANITNRDGRGFRGGH
jgi:hypothetical protein